MGMALLCRAAVSNGDLPRQSSTVCKMEIRDMLLYPKGTATSRSQPVTTLYGVQADGIVESGLGWGP